MTVELLTLATCLALSCQILSSPFMQGEYYIWKVDSSEHFKIVCILFLTIIGIRDLGQVSNLLHLTIGKVACHCEVIVLLSIDQILISVGLIQSH